MEKIVTDDVLENCVPETYIISFTNVTPINSITTKIKKTRKNCKSLLKDAK